MEKSLASKVQEANAALIGNGELDAVEEYFTQDYIVHLTNQDMAGGHKAVRDAISMLHRSFSDIQVDVEILLAGEQRVCWHRTLSATHQKSFKGFPGSGLQIVWREMVTSEFQGGLIKEEWLVTDLAEQLLRSRKR